MTAVGNARCSKVDRPVWANRRFGPLSGRAFCDQGRAIWRLCYINATSTRECGFRAGVVAECRRMRGEKFRVVKGLSAK